jgi:hypothetical protein
VTDPHKALDRIAKLRPRTIARGASEAEQQAAQMAIGKIIMECLELQIVVGSHAQARVETRGRTRDPDWVICEECFLIRKTDKAGLFDIEGEQIWIPKSLIKFSESYLPGGMLCVKKWFYERELSSIFAGVA